ncbi:MAG: Ppx/GppA phosphatase family protein [Bacteroidota bacterium]
MTVGVIDIGTNTVLLLVARIGNDGTLEPLAYEQRVPRLGQGVDAHRVLRAESIRRTIAVLKEYRSMMEAHAVDRTIVCGTSAVRDAANREDFAGQVREATGVALEVLSGHEEALWSFRGAVSGIPGIEAATVLDIGGGSTEITIGKGTEISGRMSLNIGSVRITERLFRHDPPTDPELEAAVDWIEEEIARAAHFPVAGTTLVGVAGTATALAVLAQGLSQFNVRAVTNYPISLDVVDALFRQVSVMPSSKIRDLSEVMEGRSDVITAGALILRKIMLHLRFDRLLVSERGLRYGLAERELQRQSRDEREERRET